MMASQNGVSLYVKSAQVIRGERWMKTFHPAMPLVEQLLDVRTLQGATSLDHLQWLLPNGNHVAIAFDAEGVRLRPYGGKITINRDTLKPGEERLIAPESGKHTLGIGNLIFTIQVS